MTQTSPPGSGIIVLTGAAGRIGRMLRDRLARPGRVLRLVDIAPLVAGAPARRSSRRRSPTWPR